MHNSISHAAGVCFFKHRSRLLLCSVATLSLVCAAAPPARATPKGWSTAAVPFKIPEQDLETSLLAFAEQAGVQLVLSSADVTSLRAPSVVGNFAPAEALEMVLGSSSLTAKWVGTRTLAMEQAAPNAATPPAASGEPEIEDIIVTARKRTERLQDAPVTVTAIDSETLSRNITNDVRDLRRIAPSVAITETAGVSHISMRGVENTATASNEDPEVILNVDGVVVARPEFQGLTFFDLDRIEVLRGPQGTLYGRNATGGAINLITAKPTEDLDGYVRLTGGNYNFGKAEGAIGGPITENILGRFAFVATTRGGYGKNIVTGNDINDDKRYGLRGQVQFNLSQDVQFLLSADYSVEDDHSGQPSYLRETYPGSTNSSLRPAGRGGFSNPLSRDLAGDIDPKLYRRLWSVSGTLDWKLSDALSFKSITAYRDGYQYFLQDYDFSSVRTSVATNGFPVAITFVGTGARQVSQEVQFNLDGDLLGRPVHVITGGYYFGETVTVVLTQGASRYSGEDGGPLRLRAPGRGESNSYAGFWNLGYDIVPWATLRAGGRFTRDEKKIDNAQYARSANGLGPIVVTDSTATVRLPGDDERAFNRYTNEAGIDIKPSRDILLYYTYAEGFRSGSGLLQQTTTGIINPTTVTNHELGIKSELFDHALTLNVAAFSAEYKGLQRVVRIPTASGIASTQLFLNAGALQARGVEVEYTWRPIDNFRLGGSITYLHTKFVGDYITLNPLDPNSVLAPTLALVNLRGNSSADSPKWRFTINPSYDFHLAGGGHFTLGANLFYTGQQYFSDFDDPALQEGKYVLVDGSLTYYPPDGRWSAGLYGKNLTNEFRKSAANASGFSRILNQYLIAPRTWGGTVNYRF